MYKNCNYSIIDINYSVDIVGKIRIKSKNIIYIQGVQQKKKNRSIWKNKNSIAYIKFTKTARNKHNSKLEEI